MLAKNKVQAINGLTNGLSLFQFLTYVLMVLKIFFFSYLIVPNFIQTVKVMKSLAFRVITVQIILSVLYYSSTAIVLFFGFIVTVSDPTDDVVLLENKCKLEGFISYYRSIYIIRKPFDSDSYDYQCGYCMTCVQKNSKHCRICNRQFLTMSCLSPYLDVQPTLTIIVFGSITALRRKTTSKHRLTRSIKHTCKVFSGYNHKLGLLNFYFRFICPSFYNRLLYEKS